METIKSFEQSLVKRKGTVNAQFDFLSDAYSNSAGESSNPKGAM